MSPEVALDVLHRALSWKPIPLVLAALWFAVPTWGLWLIATAIVVLTPLLVYALGSMRRWGWLAAYGLMVVLPLLVFASAGDAGLIARFLWSMLPFVTTLLYGVALQSTVATWHLERQYALQWKGDGAVSAPGSPRTAR